ncbi:hypothetical protein O6H91_14G016400 [Diphasiastrum complanatum]|uniref:Uncharacterized protein n=2 Tax=Diphasiastrum complanatum TaxID=34168 RepID=A0ACC2BLS7_DIPCM|nr:hypothetical protein O6H91_Y180800 [Diphasiastrum complanatum]KAJ7295555.1 hypothetical protein O6H91_Y180800 [Diphasiastrum complanatum]KAJ7295556.1 hypothetical protein O6H91_Y180800 [Diphasiastrum complanatum]KAJ7295557.1 hypothetical protein O6H91_Y180800 [Diphasiastrum complanatum]KAJ7295558.1 hypothetical protein O6H91_Y180800 [Diphasiastrum complanatum]
MADEMALSESQGIETSSLHEAYSPESEMCSSFPTHGRISRASTNSPTLDVRPQTIGARNRWRRLKHTVNFANHMSTYIKSAPSDFLEERRFEELLHEQSSQNAADEATREGTNSEPRVRPKGRKGLNGLIVRQEKELISFIQDFYVACLKMPIALFLAGVFLAPIALGLLFTPIYLFDIEGLAFDEVLGDEEVVGAVASAKQSCFAFLNVFLFALSLSTTFSGSPVAALSTYCLLVANVNTLMGQFLFVFLSGAVFARMSQPSHPIRCSKKAIIRSNDFVPTLEENPESFQAFSLRLVLTGPAPCELVDAKIRLTFRILLKLPSGSSFLSTQDLELIRPEVSYLKYGLMVRHIIDKRSPVYGHTMESLLEGDASFSLTVMGLERTSMQPIFHLEDYFVYDGDVVWDGDFADFIEINEKGQRVLDHSKLDVLKSSKGGVASSETSSMVDTKLSKKNIIDDIIGSGDTPHSSTKELVVVKSSLNSWFSIAVQRRMLWKKLSTSFTRAQW